MEPKRILFSEIHPFVRYVRRLVIVRETYPSASDVFPYDCRLFYVIEGKGALRIEGESRRLRRGEVVVWRSGTPYYLRSDESDPLLLLGVNFDFTQSMREFTVPIPPDPVESIDRQRAWECVEFKDFTKLNHLLHMSNMQLAEERLMEMLREYKAQKLFCDERLSGMLMDLLVLMSRGVALSDPDRNRSQAKMDDVLDYVHAHYAEELTNAQLGARFGYHPNYLNRQIKLYTGKSLHQYLLHYRVARAIDLLISSDLPVSEVAARVGFRDLCHFSKIFRQKTGFSPNALRAGSSLGMEWTLLP